MDEKQQDRKERFLAHYGRILALLLCLGLLMHAAVPDRIYSAREKRSLAAWPAFSVSALKDGSLTERLDSYMADQFPARDWFMYLRTQAAYLLGQRESQGVYYGRGDTLMERFDEPDRALEEKTVRAVSAFAERIPESRVSFLLIPDRTAMYPEDLPAYALNADENAYIDRFLSGLSDTVQALDVRETLKNAAQAGTELYYHSDHHWTTDAAYAVLPLLADALDLAEHRWEPVTVCNSFSGSLSAKSGYRLPAYDTIRVWLPAEGEELRYAVINEETGKQSASCYEPDALYGNDPYEVFFGGNYPFLSIETEADTNRTLLVFKDSYANCLLPFLLPDFSRIDIIDPRYYAEDLNVFLEWEHYSEILFICNAGTLAEDTNLAELLGQ